jgi:hypothetical protein
MTNATPTPSPATALDWLEQAAREWSPTGTIRLDTLPDQRYRVMFCPGNEGRPYFALTGCDGFWGVEQNWEIVSRHETLDEAKLACERHAADPHQGKS